MLGFQVQYSYSLDLSRFALGGRGRTSDASCVVSRVMEQRLPQSTVARCGDRGSAEVDTENDPSLLRLEGLGL